MRVALVVWTRTSIIYTLTGCAIIMLAVTLVAGVTLFPSSGHTEKRQQQSGPLNRASHPMGNASPLWAHMADGNSGLYVVDAKGTHLRRLTNGDMPAWSPDGSKLVFSRHIDDRTEPLMIINADGTGEYAINTGYPKNQFACWSPDGRRFVLTLDGPQDWGIFTMNIDGSDQKKLGRWMQPVWSPDGKHIAFVGKANPADAEGPRIFVVNTDGTQKHQVSTAAGSHEYPAWSPDGQRIAYFASEKVNGKWNALIRIVNADGSGDVAVGAHSSPYLDEIPSWFPDGKRLAIQSNRDGAMAIYIIDLNGKTLARVAP